MKLNLHQFQQDAVKTFGSSSPEAGERRLLYVLGACFALGFVGLPIGLLALPEGMPLSHQLWLGAGSGMLAVWVAVFVVNLAMPVVQAGRRLLALRGTGSPVAPRGGEAQPA